MFYGVNTAALGFRLVFVSLTFIFFAELGEDALIALGIVEDHLSEEGLHQLGTNISQALAVGLAMFWNFGVNRLWTYNDVSSTGEDEIGHNNVSSAGE